jgi:hypothetical protein
MVRASKLVREEKIKGQLGFGFLAYDFCLFSFISFLFISLSYLVFFLFVPSFFLGFFSPLFIFLGFLLEKDKLKLKKIIFENFYIIFFLKNDF